MMSEAFEEQEELLDEAQQRDEREATYFVEKDRFLNEVEEFWAAADKLETNRWSQESLFKLYRMLQTIDKYQEQPQLLDPHLEAIVAPLMQRLLDGIKQFNQNNDDNQKHILIEKWHPFFSIISGLAKTRGYKTVIRFFTHEVADLEPCLDFLGYLGAHKDLAQYWQTRYIMLLWTSLIAMVPFDLTRVDSGDENAVPLVQRILGHGKHFLRSVGKEFEGAAILIMRVLTRKDTLNTLLIPFIQESFESLDKSESIFEIRGLVAALCSIYKYGPRQTLLPTAHYVQNCCALINSPQIKNNALMRKQVVKLGQRIALCTIKPRVARWRYQRVSRSLAANLKSESLGGLVASVTTTTQDNDEDNFDDLPDEMEEIVGMLLDGLRDRDTIVRWTSAKGIGRIAERLNFELADDIVGSIIDIMSEDVELVNGSPLESSVASASDASWHGASLALAELVRRGLLLESRLKQAVPWILRALSFDQRKGSHSIGSHVRDAACYVCWSFARSYASDILVPFADKLAERLIVTCITDREVHIRRAAAAAFQENVGRHGLFPNGIEAIGIADYYNLGIRSHSFTELAPAICKLDAYAPAIIEQLATVSMHHWDKSVRILTAKALGQITEIRTSAIISTVVPKTLVWMQSAEMETRHGSILSMAEIILSLSRRNGGEWPADLIESIVKPAFESVRTFFPAYTETFGSEFTRVAGASLIDALASSGAFVGMTSSTSGISEETLQIWWKLLDTSLDRPEEEVQGATSKAIRSLCHVVGLSPERFHAYLHGLSPSSIKHRRRSVAIAFGSLSLQVLRPLVDELIPALIAAAAIIEDQVLNDAEARRNALQALSMIMSSYSTSLISDLPRPRLDLIIETILKATEDYSTDSRGDVGAWVREAAVKAIATLFEQIAVIETQTGQEDILSDELRRKAVGAVCLQSVEKIDRLREAAGRSLYRIVWNDKIRVPARDALRLVVPSDADFNWLNPKIVYPQMSKLLCIAEYRLETITGYVVSVGGLTESLVRQSSAALITFLQSLPCSLDAANSDFPVTHIGDFLSALATVFRQFQKDDRISIPLIETLDVLLTSNIIHQNIDAVSQVVELFELLKTEVLKSKSVKKLLSGIKVFAGFAALVQAADEQMRELQQRALKQLALYLGHPYPKVRRDASEAMYLLVSTSLQDCGIAPEKLAVAEELLLTTDWDNIKAADLKPVCADIKSAISA